MKQNRRRFARALAGTLRALAGMVPTSAQASPSVVLATCTKGGYGLSSGFATCPVNMGPFKVQVWCTWAGSGISPFWHAGWNSANCSRGSVSAIYVIF